MGCVIGFVYYGPETTPCESGGETESPTRERAKVTKCSRAWMRATADFHTSAAAVRHVSKMEPTFRVDAVADRSITECALLKSSEKQWTLCLDSGGYSRFAANQQPIQEMNIQLTATPSTVRTAERITAEATSKEGCQGHILTAFTRLTDLAQPFSAIISKHVTSLGRGLSEPAALSCKRVRMIVVLLSR
jgi:hypothetical protein